jgi:ligand-binding sensor domain-containing protein
MTLSFSRRRIARTVLGALTVVCFMPSRMAAQDGLVKLPIVEQQDIRFKRLSFENGHPLTRVTTIVEDDQGFMWFGTLFGLYRYDGHRFKRFRHDSGRPGSLSGVSVVSLFKDRAGAIWVGSDRSLDRVHRNTQTFNPYRIDPQDSKAPPVAVLNISQDRSGILWLATPNGLRRLDPATGKVIHYRHNPKTLRP